MSRPTENEKEEVREGTEALKDIADEVQAEREAGANPLGLEDDAEQDVTEPASDDQEGPEDGEGDARPAVPIIAVTRPTV